MSGPRKSSPEHDESHEVFPEPPFGEAEDPMDLETPIFLVAMPQVQDPFFHMSVVLLVQHESEGSRGFIVNRPTGVSVSDILDGLEIPWGGNGEETAHFGGPVQPQIGTVIYRTDNAVDPDSQHEIYPGVVLTQNIHDLQALAESPPGWLRLYLGYAGWGEGQLMQEIMRHDWLTVPVTQDLIFADDPSETWRKALRSVGVEPDQLPTWSPSDAGEMAN